MEAKLTSISESVLGAALKLAETDDSIGLYVYAGTTLDKARYETHEALLEGKDAGQAYHDLAVAALLACAAYHELRKDT